MNGSAVVLVALLTAGACDRLDSIPCRPEQTPETWLASQPFLELTIAAHRFIVVQPSTTVIVYLLGLLSVGVGVRFLRIRNHQRSRAWWGVAMMLWGVGALLAGTSYQAFSYEIKCAGRATCAWTSWWEIVYLLLTVWSIDAMMLAEAHACAWGRWRRGLSVYALANGVLYLALVMTGAFVPVRLLISFEFLLLFVAPSILAFLILNAWRYRRAGGGMDLALVGTWLGLGLTVGAYGLYLALRLTQALWARGIWFSENDVLHVGLIVWMLFIAIVVAPRLRDVPTGETAPR